MVMSGQSQGEKDILEIKSQVETLIQLVQDRFLRLKRGLDSMNMDLIKSIVSADMEIDSVETKIDDLAIQFMQKRAPLGPPLRLVFSVTDVAASLERIGDCLEYVARHVLENQDLKRLFPKGWDLFIDVTQRAHQLFEKVHASLSTLNADAAKSVRELDELVDALQDRCYQLVIDEVRAGKLDIELALHLVLMVNKVESIADVACHIADTIVYIVEDINIRHSKAEG